MRKKSIIATSKSTHHLPEGYECVKKGLPQTIPVFKFGNEKRDTKIKKVNGGPGLYHQELPWSVNQAKFSFGKNRVSFTDEAARAKKYIPSVHVYKPQREEKVLTGHARSKCEGASYISEAEYIGQANPGPTAYTVDEKQTRSKSPEWKFPPTIAKTKSYKIIKSKEPDVGTYRNVDANRKSLEKKNLVAVFGRPNNGDRHTEKPTFTKSMAQMKKFMPGVGSYTPNYTVTSKPTNLKQRI